jgi:uncharacterized membrane protein
VSGSISFVIAETELRGRAGLRYERTRALCVTMVFVRMAVALRLAHLQKDAALSVPMILLRQPVFSAAPLFPCAVDLF